jgi:hypothetical protein
MQHNKPKNRRQPTTIHICGNSRELQQNLYLIMRFTKSAVLLLPVFQANAFTGLNAIRPPSRIETTLNTATNPFEVTSKVSDIYSSVTDPNGPDLAIAKVKVENSCVEAGLVEYCPIEGETPKSTNEFIEGILSSYIGPRAVLAAVAILYATNFSLGAIMNDNLPASAATSGRMVLASIVLSPFLLQLKPSLRWQVLLGGAFVSLGYVTQSIALIDTSPALVSFLGSATVIVCPVLQW